MIGVGTKVKKIRELKNFTQEYMAEKLGISQPAYARYENPDTDIKPDMLQQIAEILEVTPEQIKNFDESQIFNNHTENANDSNNSTVSSIVMGSVNHYTVDPKIEQLYEKQIKLLEKQNQLLEEKIAALEKTLGKDDTDTEE